ncbi:lysozyme-like [Coccinella septempunctata]|uniref:lysozyme-like n=1 Tax=Coccinella septempunctata TaxID=41139 RepID=UPI001D099510|nr:lysozyme-like [Coccinella septempunctata]
MDKLYVIGVLALCFAGAISEDLPVTQQCLGCLCEASSNCDISGQCAGDVCGPFRITWAYWADAGKPTVNNEATDAPQAYAHCAADTYCSALAVQGYMQKFQQDCNGDNRIDCDDFALIHKYGGYGCKGQALPGVFGQRYQQCKILVGGQGQQ